MTKEVEAAKGRRGPDGRYLPKEGAEAAPASAGEAAQSSPAPDAMRDLMGDQQGATGSEGTAAPDAAPQEGDAGFEFAGERFKDRKDAEDRYKTVRGMIKAADARARQAMEVARQYEQHLARMQEMRGAQGPAEPGTAEAPKTAQRFVESIGNEGWQTYEQLRESKGETFANAWLNDKFEDHVESRLQSLYEQLHQELSERFPWLEEQNNQLETIKNVAELWKEFKGLADDNGNPRYPELFERDPEKLQKTVTKIGKIWKQFVERADPETIRDPYWMDVAITEYRRREANGRQGDSGRGPDNLDRLQRAAQHRDTDAVAGGGAPMRERTPDSGRKTVESLFTSNPERQKWGFDL